MYKCWPVYKTKSILPKQITTVHQFILASIQFRGKINVSPELNSHLDLFESNPVVFITFSAVLKKTDLDIYLSRTLKIKVTKMDSVCSIIFLIEAGCNGYFWLVANVVFKCCLNDCSIYVETFIIQIFSTWLPYGLAPL